jgi:preprotein translocase YajC subunit
MLAVLAGGFWLLVMRPARARQQAAIKLVNELKVGDYVMTTAGLFGTVRDLTDRDLGLEIADGVVVRYVREAIAKIVQPEETQAPDKMGSTNATLDVSLDHDGDAVDSASRK